MDKWYTVCSFFYGCMVHDICWIETCATLLILVSTVQGYYLFWFSTVPCAGGNVAVGIAPAIV